MSNGPVAAESAGARKRNREPLRPEEWAWIVTELKQALGDTIACLGIVLAAHRWEGQKEALAVRPPVDLEAERAVLAASIVANELESWVRPEDFGEPLHRSLAAALATGELTDDIAYPEVVGYLRGLLRGHDRAADALPAVLRVAALARQRRALQLVDEAVHELRQTSCDHAAAVRRLRLAIEHLEGG
jgi:hypothetical protein